MITFQTHLRHVEHCVKSVTYRNTTWDWGSGEQVPAQQVQVQVAVAGYELVWYDVDQEREFIGLIRIPLLSSKYM